MRDLRDMKWLHDVVGVITDQGVRCMMLRSKAPGEIVGTADLTDGRRVSVRVQADETGATVKVKQVS